MFWKTEIFPNAESFHHDKQGFISYIILAPGGTTSVTFPTGSMHFIFLLGITICHVICMPSHLPHIKQNWCYLQFVQFGKCNIFHRPDEAMLFVMVKDYLHLEIFLFLSPLRTLFFL